MKTSLVMTVVGADRPGLIEAIATEIAERGGNWLESRMCRLSGQFAGIVRAHVPSEKESEIAAALRSLSSLGLAVQVVLEREPALPADRSTVELEIIGHDRPGIVRKISHVLARHGVNVDELTTSRGSAPMSGEMLFQAHALLLLPENCSLDSLRHDLEAVAADMMIDVSFAGVRRGGI
jgi:glycine cleavage system regulatory protein